LGLACFFIFFNKVGFVDTDSVDNRQGEVDLGKDSGKKDRNSDQEEDLADNHFHKVIVVVVVHMVVVVVVDRMVVDKEMIGQSCMEIGQSCMEIRQSCMDCLEDHLEDCLGDHLGDCLGDHLGEFSCRNWDLLHPEEPLLQSRESDQCGGR